MQNKIFDHINVSTRILILLLLILSIFIANSIFLIIFITILLFIFIMLTNKSVKFYLDLLKKVKYWLLFIFIAYIIMIENISGSLLFIYKIILIFLFVKQFTLTINFNSLNSGIKTLLKPLNKINIDKISYNIVSFIYFIKFYINSKQEIFLNYDSKKRIYYNFSLKHNIFPRLFLCMKKIKQLKSTENIKFFKVKFEEKNITSILTLFIFFVLFIVIIFKEVIM